MRNLAEISVWQVISVGKTDCLLDLKRLRSNLRDEFETNNKTMKLKRIALGLIYTHKCSNVMFKNGVHHLPGTEIKSYRILFQFLLLIFPFFVGGFSETIHLSDGIDGWLPNLFAQFLRPDCDEIRVIQ